MTQQTAVEWLVEKILCENKEYINDYGDYIQIPKIVFYNAFKDYVDLSDYINEAKQMEKQQIIDAHFTGWSDAYDYLKNIVTAARQAEDYYNETFISTPQDESPSARET